MSLQDPVTKEELKLMMEVQAKSTEQMVIVAQRLQEIVQGQLSVKDEHRACAGCHEKIIERVTTGMLQDLSTLLAEKVIACQSHWEEEKQALDSIKKDTGWQKIIFGSLMGLVAIAFLINQIVAHFATHGVK